MNLCVHGELAFDLLLKKNSEFKPIYGGAGIYASIAAAKQNTNVDFLTVYNDEVEKYYISILKNFGISFNLAKQDNNYVVPRYLVSGYKNYEKKVSRPLQTVKQNYEFTIPEKCDALLIFPLGHSIPMKLIKEAKKKDITVFLDPKPNEQSIRDAKKILNSIDFLLVNEQELKKITETERIKDAIIHIKKSGIKNVIVKRGARGVTLISKGEEYDIPAYKSNPVCTLGSGDVFAGAFASSFMQTNDLKYSVKLASCVVADFIEKGQALKIMNKKAVEEEMYERPTLDLPVNIETSIYLAGPFFNKAEKWWVDYVYNKLQEANLQVCSPSKESGIITQDTPVEQKKNIFKEDLENIEKSDIIVALLDGNDSGTNFEIGYAYSINKPIIGLKTSKTKLNNMIINGCNSIFYSVEKLISEIYKNV